MPLRTDELEANDANEANTSNRPRTSRFEPIYHTSETGRAILSARKHANSPKAFDYLTNMLIPWPTATQDAYDDLRIQSLFGNLSMVRHLLHLGVPVQRPNVCFETPLVMACRGLHHDMVDLLLENGADPNFFGHVGMPVLPLHESTTAGNLTIARKLLARGALPTPMYLGNSKYPALWWAFAHEHMDMVKLLLKHRATFDAPNWRGKDWVGKDLAELVCYLKYDSMADILRHEYGFEIRNPLPILPNGPDDGWQWRWIEAGMAKGQRIRLYKWRDTYD